jgi:uncharacterized protein YprB with RNaseH-like and TPR domain
LSEPKRLFFDIEATRLDARWGVILCIGYRLGDGKIKIPTLNDFSPKDCLDDKGLVRHFAEEVYPLADFSIGHFSTYYDIPFINTRLIKHGLKPLPNAKFIPHIDTWKTARYKLKLDNNRLATIQNFFASEFKKTDVDPEHWARAAIGCKKSLKYIVEHCKYDILVLEDIYAKIKPLIDEPSRHLFDDEGCVECGSHKLQRRGFARTLTRKYPRYQCTACGRWQKGNKAA